MARFPNVYAVKITKEHTHAVNRAGSKAMRFYEGDIKTAEEVADLHRVDKEDVAKAFGHMVAMGWAEDAEGDGEKPPAAGRQKKNRGAAPENKATA